MAQDFDSWLAQYVAEASDEDEAGGGFNRNWLPWLHTVFEEWGPLPTADVEELLEVEFRRLHAVQLDAVRRLLPAVVADGHAVGMMLDVVLELTLTTEYGAHLEVIASPEPGSRYYQTSSGDEMELFLTDAELLAWLADQVQEATMERDQVHCFVGRHALCISLAAMQSLRRGRRSGVVTAAAATFSLELASLTYCRSWNVWSPGSAGSRSDRSAREWHICAVPNLDPGR